MGQKATSSKAVVTPDPLGTRLRDRRQSLGLTLKDVGDQAGLSVGFISQIERGITIPSLTSLINVCRVLRSEVGDFLTQPRGDKPVTRHDERPVYALGDNAITYERLSAAFPGNVLRSIIFHEPPGFRSEPMAHEGEEIFFILEGAVDHRDRRRAHHPRDRGLRAFPVDADACDLEPHHVRPRPCCTPARWTCSAMERRRARPKPAWPYRVRTAARVHRSQLKIKKGKSS